MTERALPGPIAPDGGAARSATSGDHRPAVARSRARARACSPRAPPTSASACAPRCRPTRCGCRRCTAVTSRRRRAQRRRLSHVAAAGGRGRDAHAGRRARPCAPPTACPCSSRDRAGTRRRRRARGLARPRGGRARGDRRCARRPRTTSPRGSDPAIGPNAFEVGRDVLRRLLRRRSEMRGALRPAARGQVARRPARDSRAAALAAVGVTRVDGGTWCTHSDAARFHLVSPRQVDRAHGARRVAR